LTVGSLRPSRADDQAREELALSGPVVW